MASFNNDVSTFKVTAHETEGCLKLGFRGKYKLQVGVSAVRLIHHETGSVIAHWPVPLIRNYGFSTEAFFLQSGQRTETGEGKFIFSTMEGHIITNCIKFQAQHLQNQIKRCDENSDEEKASMGATKSNVNQFHSGDIHSSSSETDHYHNYELYSHLKRKDLHIPENVYGMSSASAPIKPKENKAPHKKSRDKNYENIYL